MEYISAHDRPSLAFKDILKDRHDESDLVWVSREITTSRAYKQTKESTNHRKLQESVLKSPRIQKLIEDVSYLGMIKFG